MFAPYSCCRECRCTRPSLLRFWRLGYRCAGGRCAEGSFFGRGWFVCFCWGNGVVVVVVVMGFGGMLGEVGDAVWMNGPGSVITVADQVKDNGLSGIFLGF